MFLRPDPPMPADDGSPEAADANNGWWFLKSKRLARARRRLYNELCRDNPKAWRWELKLDKRLADLKAEEEKCHRERYPFVLRFLAALSFFALN